MAYPLLHDQTYVIQFKSGSSTAIALSATTAVASQAEPHWTTDTNCLYVFNGTNNIPVVSQVPITSVTTSYTATTSDYIINCSGTLTATLPTITTVGRSYVFINSGTGTVTVNTFQILDGATSKSLSSQYSSISVVSVSTGWLIYSQR